MSHEMRMKFHRTNWEDLPMGMQIERMREEVKDLQATVNNLVSLFGDYKIHQHDKDGTILLNPSRRKSDPCVGKFRHAKNHF